MFLLSLFVACESVTPSTGKPESDTAGDSGGDTAVDESTPTDLENPTAGCRAEGVSAAGVTATYWYDGAGYLVQDQTTNANYPDDGTRNYEDTYVNNADGYKLSAVVDELIDGTIEADVTWERNAGNFWIVKTIDTGADGSIDARMEDPRDDDGFTTAYTLDSPVGGDLESSCTTKRTDAGDDTLLESGCDTNADGDDDYLAVDHWMRERHLVASSITDSDADGQADSDYAATYTDFDALAETLSQTYKRNGKVDVHDRGRYEYDEYDRLITYAVDVDDDGSVDASMLYDWICRE